MNHRCLDGLYKTLAPAVVVSVEPDILVGGERVKRFVVSLVGFELTR